LCPGSVAQRRTSSAGPDLGDPSPHGTIARRALESGMTMTADEIIIMHGCIESMNLALRAVTKPGDRGRVKIRKYWDGPPTFHRADT
jgi:DNA-binding transcriptional MocR family regulator